MTEFAARIYEGTKTYRPDSEEPVFALRNVTTGFPANRFTAIMGPSGSGKSTLMQCMAGLDTLSSGRTFIGDIETTHLSPTELTHIRRERLGFVFQSFNLVPSLTAERNIRLPAKMAGMRLDESHFASVISTLGLANRLNHRPAQLSGGQQQRVAVARALVTRPEIIFADEPTGNLDSTSSAAILGYLREATDAGSTVVMVTHDPTAAAHADHVLFLNDGMIVSQLDRPSATAIIDTVRHLRGINA